MGENCMEGGEPIYRTGEAGLGRGPGSWAGTKIFFNFSYFISFFFIIVFFLFLSLGFRSIRLISVELPRGLEIVGPFSSQCFSPEASL